MNVRVVKNVMNEKNVKNENNDMNEKNVKNDNNDRNVTNVKNDNNDRNVTNDQNVKNVNHAPPQNSKRHPRNYPRVPLLVKKAATYSPALRCSTIGAPGLNFSVRDGKRWNTGAKAT